MNISTYWAIHPQVIVRESTFGFNMRHSIRSHLWGFDTEITDNWWMVSCFIYRFTYPPKIVLTSTKHNSFFVKIWYSKKCLWWLMALWFYTRSMSFSNVQLVFMHIIHFCLFVFIFVYILSDTWGNKLT